jgi:hypothetical protein
MSKKSLGVNLDASGGAIVEQEVFRVPNGYKAVVTMFFLSNTGGSTTTVDARWHDGTTVPFLGGKNLGSGDYLQFGGPLGAFLCMQQGDHLDVSVSNGGQVGLIISYDLLREDSQA